MITLVNIIIGVVMAVIGILLTLFSLARNLDSSILRFLTFCLPVKAYFRAREAIEKLGDLKNTTDTIKLSILTNRDTGFRELVMILLKCGLLSGNIDELRLERKRRVAINMPVGGFQSLIAKKDGVEEVIIDTTRSDQQPEDVLKKKADAFIREIIKTYIIFLAIAFFILSIYIALVSNLT